MGFWPVVLNVLRNSDIVLLILDARLPEVAQNSEIITKTEKIQKQLILIFNKTDLISSTDQKTLKEKYKNSFQISALKKTGIKQLKSHLESLAVQHKRESLRIGIVGYPNAGKSSLINALAPGSNLKVKSVSGTTKKTAWIRLGKLRIMDSPGVIPSGDDKIKLGLTASKDPHKIKNPERIALKILDFLLKKDKTILENLYKITLKENEEAQEAFEAIGRKKGFLVKGGIVEEDKTAIKIIDDWQKGKISLK